MRMRRAKLWVCALVVVSMAPLADADIKTGLVGYWKLDEGVGTTVRDSSGNGNHGTFDRRSRGLPGMDDRR